jgi:NADH-quinone oxidoreductase subunit C
VSTQEESIAAVKAAFPDDVVGTGMHAGQHWVFVKRERVIDALRLLRDKHGYEMLMDLTAVDYLNQGTPERFCVVYELYSLANNEYFRVKTWLPEGDPEVDTAGGLWKSAPWAEREVWDMFGITFRGNKDLRRILMPTDYPGHPLRKDYPLKGNGERFNFPKYTR